MRSITSGSGGLSAICGKRLQITNGIPRQSRTRSRGNTASSFGRCLTGQASRYLTVAAGCVSRMRERLNGRLMRTVMALRRARVESLRSEAYNGGDVDRYVQARKDYWHRYEK